MHSIHLDTFSSALEKTAAGVTGVPIPDRDSAHLPLGGPQYHRWRPTGPASSGCSPRKRTPHSMSKEVLPRVLILMLALMFADHRFGHGMFVVNGNMYPGQREIFCPKPSGSHVHACTQAHTHAACTHACTHVCMYASEHTHKQGTRARAPTQARGH